MRGAAKRLKELCPHVPDSGFYVYMLNDKHDPLYIGQSTQPKKRLRAHLTEPSVRAAVHSIQLIKCEDMTHMDETEKRLIDVHKPYWNYQRGWEKNPRR